MREIVASGDWHGDKSTVGYDRFGDFDQATAEVEEAARSAGAFIFLGDLTDPDNVRSHRTVAKAVGISKRLEADKVSQLWITGNHDVIEDGSGGHTLMAIQALTGDRRVIDAPSVIQDWSGAVDLIVLPFTPRMIAYDPVAFIVEAGKSLKKSKRPVLVVGHLTLRGIAPGSETLDMPRGRDEYWPTDVIREVFGDRATMVGGHYHNQQVYDGVHIAGSLERLTLGDRESDCGYLRLEF